MGDIVESGIGLSYRPASLCSLGLTGQYNNPMQELTLSPTVRDYEFGSCSLVKFFSYVLSAEACLLIFTFVKDDFYLLHFSTAD
jgi:hypothetical protein